MNINKLAPLIITLHLVAVFSGCSTIAAHSKDDVTPPPYAGTNIAIMKTKKEWYKFDLYGVIVLSAFDVPFSLMADTLLYPVDVYRDNYITETEK